MVSQIDYPTRNIITRHPISSDPLSKTPSNPNSGQSGAVHSLTVQKRLLRSLPPMRGSIGESRCTPYTVLQGYSVCMEYGSIMVLVFLLSLCTQPRLVGSPKALSTGLCTMPPPTITTIPEPEAQTTHWSKPLSYAQINSTKHFLTIGTPGLLSQSLANNGCHLYADC